jgi:uncharacterized membrane protein YczE
MMLFSAYQETLTPDYILMILNGINYFINMFLLSFFTLIGLGNAGYTHKNYIQSELFYRSKYSLYINAALLSLVLTILNKQYHIYFNIYCYYFYLLCLLTLLFINIERKSLKWFSSLLVFFIGIVFVVYLGALYLIARINTTGLEQFGLMEYSILYKSLFKIYEINDQLLGINYIINGKEYLIENNIMYKRIYIFYYFMNSFAALFWLFVYHKVLGFHAIKLGKNLIKIDKDIANV